MTIISRKEFFNIVLEFCMDHQQDVYVLFMWYRRRQEAEQATIEDLNLEYLQMDWTSCCHVWLHDWDEGEEYIVFEGLYTEEMIIEKLIERK